MQFIKRKTSSNATLDLICQWKSHVTNDKKCKQNKLIWHSTSTPAPPPTKQWPDCIVPLTFTSWQTVGTYSPLPKTYDFTGIFLLLLFFMWFLLVLSHYRFDISWHIQETKNKYILHASNSTKLKERNFLQPCCR